MITDYEKADIAKAYLRRGREEGLAAGKREMALTMLSDGVPVQQISKWTGLSEKDIEALKG